MITRIVKMTFKEEAVDDFLTLFHSRKAEIRQFPGCHQLRLLRDTVHQNIFFTYSKWINEAALEGYRRSAFFKETWGMTKSLFQDRAEAWSTELLVNE